MGYLDFEKFITKQLMTAIYIIGAIILTLLSVVWVMTFPTKDGLNLWGFVWLTVGNLLWRLGCEMIVVIFKINENLEAIKQQTAPKTP